MNIAVFAYNFPHKKTQDFLFNLYLAGIDVCCVIASDPVQLNIPPSNLRIKPRHIDLIHPQELCDKFGYPYFVSQHNSEQAQKILSEYEVELGIIAGARILKQHIIDTFRKGVINFHPGVLPYARGLDAVKWSVYNNIPLGVTAHLIDARIDAGRIIDIKEIELYADDSFVDISLRIEQLQNKMLIPSIEKILAVNNFESFTTVDVSYKYNRSMPHDIEALLPQLLDERLRKLHS